MVDDGLKFIKFVIKKKFLKELLVALEHFILFFTKYKNFIGFFFRVSLTLQVGYFNSTFFAEKLFDGFNFCDFTANLNFLSFSSLLITKFSSSIFNWLNSYNIRESDILFGFLKCVTHNNILPFLEDYFLIFHLRSDFISSSLKVNDLIYDDLICDLQRYSDFQFFLLKKNGYVFLKNFTFLFLFRLKLFYLRFLRKLNIYLCRINFLKF